MCTVSFIANKESFILTSNRDEDTKRQASFSGEFQLWNGVKLLFPKDPKAGGSWFAMCEKGNVGILLNGAFVSHYSMPSYFKSRGLILLDCLASEQPSSFIRTLVLKEIEPFTLILFEENTLMEFRWDGEILHAKQLDKQGSYIWSSAKLYSSKTIEQRERLFEDFLTNKKEFSGETIIDFHSSQEVETQNGFVINRGGIVQTLSITQVKLSIRKKSFMHKNLMTNDKVVIDLK